MLMFKNLDGVSSCVWEQMDTGRYVYIYVSRHGMGLKLYIFEGLGFFLAVIKITVDLRRMCQSPASSQCNLICVKCCTAREGRGRICFAFVFACVVGENQKASNLSPIADNVITQGGI